MKPRQRAPRAPRAKMERKEVPEMARASADFHRKNMKLP